MIDDPYHDLANRLDALPNGFPPTPDGVELRLLRKLFTTQEAELASNLRLSLETPEQIETRLRFDLDIKELKILLRDMARKGLVRAGRTDKGMGYGLMPFVVGIYEAQIGRIDAELAKLFEEYYTVAFPSVLNIQPAYHRVIPVNQSVKVDMEIRPYESASEIVNQAQSWGVLDCICRTQKALIGQPCEHPLDMCMVFSHVPGAFDYHPVIRALDHQQALETLTRAAKAGLVHTVSNNQRGTWYLCNCCTCSCGILRGIAEMGLANAVAHSAFVNVVNQNLCTGCELCVEWCQFSALSLQEGLMQINALRCVGCGVCVPNCPENALSLLRRNEEEILSIPLNELEWFASRANARGRDLGEVL